jgi:DNA-binding NarL/FixJ family response regulator
MLADDHKVFLEGLEALLSKKDDISIIAKASDGQEILHLLQIHSPDILLLDINMPKLDGLEVMKHINDQKKPVKVIILSTYNDYIITKKLLQMGISGYLPKSVAVDELIIAIKKVYEGEIYLNQEVIKKLQIKETHNDEYDTFTKKYHITKRELEVLKLIIEEKTTNEIAHISELSTYTIDVYRKNLLKKLEVKNVAGLIRIALENKLI